MVAGALSRPNRSVMVAAVMAAAVLTGGATAISLSGGRKAAPPVQEVVVPAGAFSYRPSGEFLRGTQPIDPPLRQIRIAKPFVAMQRQVSEAEYDLCVQAGACRPQDGPHGVRADYPVINVSFEDATAYARWLSGLSGSVWRLPSDEEWAYMAGSRFNDDALGLGDDADFSRRWLARYEREGALRDDGEIETKASGHFGKNEHGLVDVSGNVWEWTTTCFARHNPEGAGADGKPFQNCGVRVTEGRHRAYVSDFIRDARGGGCAAGIPPSNLGFRLVRDAV